MAPSTSTPQAQRKARRTEYSPRTRGRIATAYAQGSRIIDIAKDLNIPQGSISGIVKRYSSQDQGHSKPRSGRTSVISECDKRRIQQAVSEAPSHSAKDIRPKYGIKASRSTIYSTMKASGLSYWKAFPRAKLSPDSASERLELAEKCAQERRVSWW